MLCPVNEFMAGLPELRLEIAEEPKATAPNPEETIVTSGYTNADRREWDRQLRALGWKREIVELVDEYTGEVERRQVWYSHPDYPNSENTAGWTAQTAMLYSGLLTGRRR